MKRKTAANFMRNFVFGVEDSLVSTVGLLSGVAIADVPRNTLILTGLVLIFVEAFSMGVGSFLSEHSAEEYMRGEEVAERTTIVGGIIMFFSYFFSGFIPLLPYLFITNGIIALWISIFVSLVTLFVLGVISAKFSKTSLLKHGLRMLFIGGGAVVIGAVVGSIVSSM